MSLLIDSLVSFWRNRCLSRSARRRTGFPRKIEAMECRMVLSASPVSVLGLAQWTDSENGKHGIPGADVEIYDRDSGGVSNLIGTTATDNAGGYAFSGSYDDGSNGTADVFVRVLARSRVADVKPVGALAKTYFLETSVIENIAAKSSAELNVTAGNVSDNDTAFSVFHAVQLISAYTGTLTGKIPLTIDVRYDSTVVGSKCNATAKQFVIRGTAKFEWDEIQHEYGHYIQALGGFQENPGLNHYIGDNLTVSTGKKDLGVRLAWGEGWPTYFAISGQQMMGAAALKIPEVGDTIYQAWDVYKPENRNIVSNLEIDAGLGEDNEISVMATLWDLFDSHADGSDALQMTDISLYNLFRGAKVTTVGQAWEALASKVDKAGKAELGAVFAQNHIAPNWAASNPADNSTMTVAPMTFSWDKNGGGTPNPLNDFRIRFYSSDFSRVIFQQDLGDVASYTPESADWATIKGGDSVVKYVIEGRDKRPMATPEGSLGYYWSGARTLGGVKIAFVIDDTGSMGEEIAGVRNALQQYIDTVAAKLKPGDVPPTIQLMTFKDNVTVRITSSDLAAVRSAVGSLVASGGDDCPEFSAQALAQAVENVASGGTILLATDASTQPGVDYNAVLTKLRAKHITLNTILSGDCAGIDSSGGSEVRVAAADLGLGGAGLGVGGIARMSAAPIPDGVDSDPATDDPGFTLTDPGQAPIDDHGNTIKDPTLLVPNGSYVIGALRDATDPADVFAVDLAASKRYVIQIVTPDNSRVKVELLGASGTISLTTKFAPESSYSHTSNIVFTSSDAGRYYVKLTRASGTSDQLYQVRTTDNPLAGVTSSVDLFSALSTGSGGTFFVRDDVNAGDSTGYQAALYNVMASTLGATVLGANPSAAPLGQTVAMTLTGAGTNWRPGESTVTFSDSRLVAKSVTVTSPTLLTVLVDIGSAVSTGFYDVTVSTPLGADTEVAKGSKVFRVTAATVAPTLLSVDPSNLSVGSLRTVTLRGANVAWAANSTVTFGPGTTVTAVRLLAADRLEADVTVSPLADIGFRTATVTTGAQQLSLDRAVFIGAGDLVIPLLSKLSVVEGQPGQTIELTITGTNTSFVNGVTTATFGDGVTVTKLRVISPTSAVATIQLQAGASAGFRDVRLATYGETATALSAFYVNVKTVATNNVTVTVVDNRLRLIGDVGNNQIRIVAVGKQFFLTGLKGTTLNGKAVLNVTAKLGIELIDLAGGNNSLTMIGLNQTGNLSIRCTDGDSTVQMIGIRLTGDANRVDFGKGKNRLEVTSSFLQTDFSITGVASNSIIYRCVVIPKKKVGR